MCKVCRERSQGARGSLDSRTEGIFFFFLPSSCNRKATKAPWWCFSFSAIFPLNLQIHWAPMISQAWWAWENQLPYGRRCRGKNGLSGNLVEKYNNRCRVFLPNIKFLPFSKKKPHGSILSLHLKKTTFFFFFFCKKTFLFVSFLKICNSEIVGPRMF